MYEFRQNEEDCLDARYADLNNVYMEKCHEMGGNQKWELRQVRYYYIVSLKFFCTFQSN